MTYANNQRHIFNPFWLSCFLLLTTSQAFGSLVYDFTGNCTIRCAGEATATIILSESYEPGTESAYEQFVQFSYNSSRYSFSYTELERQDLSPNSLRGVFPAETSSSVDVFINFPGGGTYFGMEPSGRWYSDGPGSFWDEGDSYTISLRNGFSTAPPGTASLILFSDQSTWSPLTVDNFDSSLPTILVTHGWQRGEDQYFGDGNLPRKDTVNNILTRLDEESIDANVVLYNWEGAYTTVAKESLQETYNAGVNLGTQLSTIIGSDYQQGLHMIGHSHGTGVNGFAVDLLQKQGISVDLFTVLDSPMDVTSNNPFTNADFSRDFFAATLDGDAVGYVENYVGEGPLAYGTFIQGAGNLQLPGDHGGVAEIYGSEIVAEDKIKRILFDWEWPWLTPSRNNIEASSLPEWQGEELQITRANFKDWLTLFGISYDVTCEELGAADGCSYSDVYRSLVESSPSAVSTELVIPNDVTTFMFDYVFGDTGDGDWISLYLEDQLLWELSGLSISSGLVGTAFVDIRDFLGTTGELTFLLNSVGESNLEFAFANLRFVNASSSVPLPPSIVLLMLGASILLKRRISERGKTAERRGHHLADPDQRIRNFLVPEHAFCPATAPCVVPGRAVGFLCDGDG
jgi:hypothetical protein